MAMARGPEAQQTIARFRSVLPIILTVTTGPSWLWGCDPVAGLLTTANRLQHLGPYGNRVLSMHSPLQGCGMQEAQI